MIRQATTTVLSALSLLSVCLSLDTTSAQGLTNTIPRSQPPLLRTFPPSAAEQTLSGTGKFVILTREEIGTPNEWDSIAGAWEAIPARTNVPITKRVEFSHSSWDAQPLLDCLVRDDSEGLHPRFVSLQVDTGDRDYRVNVYDINYRTWEVRSIWWGDRLYAFGLLKNSVFCRDSRDWFRFDVLSGNIIKDVPFIPLDVDGAFWLVRKVGESSGAWSYDVAKEEFVARFGEVEELNGGHRESLLSSDAKSKAWLLVPLLDNWRGGLIAGTLVLQRDGQPRDIRVPINLQARMGRGVPVIPVGTKLRFARNDMVEFSARQQVKGKDEWVWTIDVALGKATASERPYLEPKADDYALFDGVPTPDYLRKYLKDFRHFGRGGLAPAFLMHLGILKKQPEFPDCTAGVSRDGSHILFKANEGPLADVFIYGDLQTKQIVRWPCPAGIKRGDSLEFAWVETP